MIFGQLHNRRTFLKIDLIHLEDDALDARLTSARSALAAVETEYKRMTGEALADSYGDTAAANCFHEKQQKRNALNERLKHISSNLIIVSRKLKICRNDRTKCEEGVDVLYHDLINEQGVLRQEWELTSECVTQHECAMVSKSKATQEQCSCNYHCALYCNSCNYR